MIRAPAYGSWRRGQAAVGLILAAVFSLKYGSFLGSGNLSAIGLNSSAVLIAGIGTMALLVSGNVDLSIGSQYALVSTVTATVVHGTGDALLGAVAAVSLGFVLGLINGSLVQVLKISPLIVTLAMLGVYRGLAYVVSGGVGVSDLPDSFTAIGRAYWFGVPSQVMIAGLVYLAGAWVLVATVTGLRLFAIGGNRLSATRAGVPVNRLVLGTFAANGALIGLVALLGTAKLGDGAPVVGVQFELEVLTAVVLGGVAFTGGRGHPLGVLVGVVTLGVLDAGLIYAGLADSYQQIARGSLLLLSLAADQLLLVREQRHVRRGSVQPGSSPQAPPRHRTAPDIRGQSDVVLAVRDLTVCFAGVDALDSVSLRVSAGEVICLVGDNGAGKSTLAKAMCGAVRPSAGTVTLDGKTLGPHPGAARRAGVEMVFQELALCPNLSVSDNLALGLEPRRRIARILPVRDSRAAERTAHARLDALGVAIGDLHRPVRLLSGGERQLVQMLRVMRRDVRFVILDEPTAALGVHQAAEVLRLARAIAAAGHPVLFITHDVEEVFEVADRVVVLRRGRVIFDGPIASVSRLELLRLMSGRNRVEAERIVAAVNTERQRLERDIHDGAQQRLAAIAMWLDGLENRLGSGEEEAARAIARRASEELRGAIDELRRLSRGVPPPVLALEGLDAALRELTARTPGATIRGSVGEAIAPEVGVAVYFAVAEGLTNAIRHSGAAEIEVAVERANGSLRIDIRDDGSGGASIEGGSGLRGLAGRLEAQAGRLGIESSPGRGTLLRIELPIDHGRGEC